VLGIKTPWWLSLLAVIGTATGIAIALSDDIHETAEAIRRKAAAGKDVTEELPAAR
jgi:hypothetical protein